MIFILLYISAYDILHYRIEDKMLLLIAVYFMFFGNVYSFILISIVMNLFYYIVNYFFSDSFGYGDVKLFSVLAMGMNVFDAFLMVALSFLLASCYILLLRKIKGRIAFAPFICFSFYIVYFLNITSNTS